MNVFAVERDDYEIVFVADIVVVVVVVAACEVAVVGVVVFVSKVLSVAVAI